MKKVIFLITALFVSVGLSGQTLSIEVSQSNVSVEQPFQVSIIFEGEGSGNVQLPSFDDFNVHQPLMQSNQYVNINGKESFIWKATTVLSAKKEGTFKINPATITVGNKKITSNSVIIKASPVAVSKGIIKSADPVFLSVSVDKEKIYLGQGINLSVNVYYKVDFRYSQMQKPALPGLVVKEVTDPQVLDKKKRYEIVNGVKYEVVSLYETHWIPQNKGKVNIPPCELQCFIPKHVRRAPRTFEEEFDLQTKGYITETSSLKITSSPRSVTVLPLPEEGKPKDFSGAVGDYFVSAHLSKDKTKANEALNLLLTISGKGNIKLLEPPKIYFPEDFETYDPKVTEKNNTGTSGSKTFDYLFIPRHEGEYKIAPVSFSFFNPEKNKYMTITLPELTVHVDKGVAANDRPMAYTPSGKEEVKLLAKDIRYIKTSGEHFKKQGDFFFNSTGFYIALLTPFLLFLIFLFARGKYNAQQNNATYIKNKKANKIAKQSLEQAEHYLQSNQKELFYSEILKALLGYLGNKYSIVPAQLNKEKLMDILTQNNIDQKIILRVTKIIDDCEFAKYAPAAVTADLKNIYQEANELITYIEQATTARQ